MDKFLIKTYGCQMNERDSEKMAALLKRLGYTETETLEEADLIIFNTCCVRGKAEDKVFGHLSRIKNIKESRPDLLVALCGCMPQQKSLEEKIRTSYKFIDIVFGTSNRHLLPEFIHRAKATGKQVFDVSENFDQEITDIDLTERVYKYKAGVNIMQGCNNFCAYCIVPYVRGPERSRTPEDLLNEVTALTKDGATEIMLLGQNVNSYKGLDNQGKEINFTGLLAFLSANAPLLRDIRFMTSHPKDFSDELINEIQVNDKICKHIHLPLQSGSTKVLNEMNRIYTKEDYLSLAAKLKKAVPNIALSTDIIVGFPGETEGDFEDTLDVVKKVRFSGAFTFIYSKREGTPAADRTDEVPRDVSAERFERLTKEVYDIMNEINQSKIGCTIEVKVEEAGETTKARSNDHTLVHFTSSNNFNAGDVTKVKITEAKTFYLLGSEV